MQKIARPSLHRRRQVLVIGGGMALVAVLALGGPHGVLSFLNFRGSQNGKCEAPTRLAARAAETACPRVTQLRRRCLQKHSGSSLLLARDRRHSCFEAGDRASFSLHWVVKLCVGEGTEVGRESKRNVHPTMTPSNVIASSFTCATKGAESRLLSIL